MDNSSARQEDNSGNYTTPSRENEIEFDPVSSEENTENSGDSTYSLLDKESPNADIIIATEKNKVEYADDSLINPTLLVIKDNDNIVSTQSQQESKDDSHIEDEDLEHIESEQQDDDLLFVQSEDNGDSDHMVSSIHTSDDTGSENSSMRDDSSGMLVSPPDIRTPSSPSQNSEDNNSIESMPTDFSNQNEYIERDMPVVPAPGETQSQILAPLDDNDDEEDEGRIQLTPILTKAIETDDDPPSPTLSEFSPPATRRTDINTNDSNGNGNIINRSHLPRSHIPEILLRHQRHNILDFRHRQDSSLGEIVLSIFHHQILLPFFQGFSWGIGMHLYRYMRNGFSVRNFRRSLSGGVRGTSSNNID